KEGLAGIVAGALAGDELAAAEVAENAAQVAGVEVEIAGEVRGAGGIAVGELVQDANLGEGEVAFEMGFVEDVDAPGIEAVEPADGIDGWIGGTGAGRGGHGSGAELCYCQCQLYDCFCQPSPHPGALARRARERYPWNRYPIARALSPEHSHDPRPSHRHLLRPRSRPGQGMVPGRVPGRAVLR